VLQLELVRNKSLEANANHSFDLQSFIRLLGVDSQQWMANIN
jgi:hypothetical protein